MKSLFIILIYGQLAFWGGLALGTYQCHSQVLPLPGPHSPEASAALRLFTAKAFTERQNLEWLDTFKPEKDPRTQQTLDRLLFKDFLKRLPACIEAIK